jgi:hypothetical protein
MPSDDDDGLAAQIYGQPAQRREPLKLTTARWVNRKRAAKALDGTPSEKWAKVLAHSGPLTQFAYGKDHASDWSGPVQKCVIAAPHTLVIIIDVDAAARFALTPLGKALAARGLPMSHRGPDRCHYILDARSVPPGHWPSMAALYGDKDIGHCKSNGWVPVPGSEHYGGDLHEPVLNSAGKTDVITVDEEILIYRAPLPESQKIAGLACFYDEKVDVYLDGELQPRPVSPFS